MDKRLIDADKAIKMIDEAIAESRNEFYESEWKRGELNGLGVAKDIILSGQCDADTIPLPTINPGDKVRIINTADHRYINQEAIVKEVDPAPPGCAKLEGISRYWLLSSLEVVSHE